MSMATACTAQNVDVAGTCQRPAGHSGPHARHITGGRVHWWDLYGPAKRTILSLNL